MTTYNKIGFLAANVGNPSGIGDYVKRLDAAGIPAVCMCNDGTVGIMDALELIKKGSKVPHVLAYRVVRPDSSKSTEHYSVPEYAVAPVKAARKHWDMVRPRFPAELIAFKKHVWFFPVNEIRAKRNEGDIQFENMNAWDWMGEFCYELAQLSMKEGIKVAMPQANSGEPAPEDWKQPGMVKYLQLCAKHPDLCAIGLHEYCWNVNDMASSYPHQIGRVEWLFDACDELGINRPPVLIGEWGWEKGKVPGPKNAIEHIHFAAQIYAKYPSILGAGIWYLGRYQDGIENKTQKLIEPVTNYTLSDKAKFPDPPADPIHKKPMTIPKKPDKQKTKAPTQTKTVKKVVKKTISPIPESQNGLKLGRFKLQDRSDFRINKQLWFEIHYDNLLGHEIPYGGMGMAISKWTGIKWELHAYKHSYGGSESTIKAGGGPGGGEFHDDNWKADQVGFFALTPYVSFDKEAVKKKDDPAALKEVFNMGQPIYVKIGSNIEPGGVLESPPAPLFAEEVVEVEVEVEEDASVELTEEQGKTQPAIDEQDKPQPKSPSGSAQMSRQIIEWTAESGIDAVRILLSKRQGNQWLAHMDLTQAIDENSRLEFVFLKEAGVEPIQLKPAEVEKPTVTVHEPSSERVLGMDISYAQAKKVKFQKMAEAGVKYCFIRAGSGKREKDENFEHNYAEAGKAGMLRGIYYYQYPESKATIGSAIDRTPEGQARRFVSILKEDAELGAVLDVEESGLTPKEVKRFVDEFQKHDPYDRPITIYTADWYWNKARGYAGSAVEWAARHPLWVAQYTSDEEPIEPSKEFQIAIPKPWKNFAVHQWTGVGGLLVDHVQKELDLNYFAGSLAELQEWARTGVLAPSEEVVEESTKVVTADPGLNMRTGPSTAHNVITMLKKGAVVEVIEEGEWDFIRAGDFTGYVSSQLLSSLSSADVKSMRLEQDLRQGEPGEFRFVFWPTDVKHVNQRFGERPEYYKEISSGYLPAHEGIDLAAPLGTPYYCVAQGVVKRVSDKNRQGKPSAYGWHVLIDHDNGYSTLYAHATPEIRVAEGDQVSAGQILAYSGNTGNTSGAHLHLTLKKEGHELAGWPAGYMDPWPFLEPLFNNIRPPMGNLIEGYLYGSSLDIRGNRMALAKLNLNLRERPDSDSQLLAKVPKDSPVRLLSEAPKNGYYYCETSIDADVQPKKVLEAPKKDKIDLLAYIKGDGRSYEVKNDWGSQERFQIQEDGLTFYLVKNKQWEQFLYDEDFIYRDVDTSPGSGRYYRLKDPNRQRGSRWLRRRMAVGETYTQSRRVQFYIKDNGTPSADNSGDVTDTMKLVAHHKKYKFQTGVELNDVLELHWVVNQQDHTSKEKYFYARGLGMVGWARGHEDPNSPSWSAVAEIHAPGAREPFVRERVTIL